MMERHTGKGLNYACDCEFCVAKRAITKDIGNANYLMRTASAYGLQPQSLRPYCLDSDSMGNWIWHLRRAARKRARIVLRQLKEK